VVWFCSYNGDHRFQDSSIYCFFNNRFANGDFEKANGQGFIVAQTMEKEQRFRPEDSKPFICTI
jgi:hypothetical protein